MLHHHFQRGHIAQVFTFTLTLALIATAARACLWDRDTLGIEARGLPGVAEIITGRFERNPPLYYEMRLARVTKALETSPGDLDLYDDAGVACDKLGRGDEAIAWMIAKKKQLDTLGEADPKHRDHLYRYYANLGTFHAHRWVSSGKNRDDLEDMKIGRDLIAKAIEINPDAHFGREKYQLAVMEWIIALPDAGEGYIATVDRDLLGDSDAITGLTGIIALGGAWQSVDLFFALAQALQNKGHGHLSELARLRLVELFDAGHASLHPKGVNLDNVAKPSHRIARGIEDTDRESAKGYFERARVAADQWHADREAFMVAKMKAGEHPDTHADFWAGYKETAPEPVPGSSMVAATWSGFIGLQGGIVALFVAICAGLILLKVVLDRRNRLRATR